MESEEKTYKEGIAYGLWAGWLFGFAGLHRLYMGKYGTGFLWLLTWGLVGIGQLYDLITLGRQIREKNLLAEVRALRNAQREAHRNAESPAQRLLTAAQRHGGYLTVTQAVQVTGMSFERAEQVLRDMVASGYVDVDNEPESGVVIYRFPELGRSRIEQEARRSGLDASADR